jgi:hypothetical protein
MFKTRQPIPAVQIYPIRPTMVRYMLEIAGCNNRYADSSIRPYMQRLLGTDTLGAKALELLTSAWAMSTSETYGRTIKPYFEFCDRQGLPLPATTAAIIARYIAWSENSPSRRQVCSLAFQ